MKNLLNQNQPLHEVCESEVLTKEILTNILENNANPNMQDYYGWTPLQYLCCNRNITKELLTLLLEKNAMPNIQCNLKNTPLHYLCDNKNLTRELLTLLLEKNAMPNIQSLPGNTPLHYLCDNKNLTLDLLVLMLEKNANLNIKNIFGENPIDLLLSNKNLTNENIENIIIMLRLNGYINNSVIISNDNRQHRELLEKPLTELFKLEHMKLMTKTHSDKFKSLILSYKNKFASSPLLILPKPILKMIVFEYVALLDQERQECRNAVQNKK